MAVRKECIAMLLAGGQGSRLYPLTKLLAKPALYFGGKYRIIDFPLSNCINSGIDTVGVLTQYQPLELNDYIGNGGPWDLDRNFGGAHILPPYQKTEGTDWYKGTANAIYQNIPFMEKFSPKYVAILSGDHIYRMDYNAMLKKHRAKNADCTIAVIDVPLEEASRFGILTTDEDDRITEFTEKPEHPNSTKASMGIYIFSYDVLKRYLEEDALDPESENDFGKNVIPKMLGDGCAMYTYGFSDYWKDVGTISSFWEANMDLLNMDEINLSDSSSSKIYYRHEPRVPHFIGSGANVKKSMIAEGCEIYGTVENSIIFGNVCIEDGAVVRDSVIMPDTRVRREAKVNYSVLSTGIDVGEGANVGEPKELALGSITVIGENTVIENGVNIPAGASIEEGSAAAKGAIA